MKIRVPATSANLGPGFDSCGIALSQYLVIEIGEEADAWFIQHDLGEDIPVDESNLLLSTALKLAPHMTPRNLVMTSDIPLARGLGSSSSVIVAGIELANRLGELKLSTQSKVQIATEIEGHPDNVAPAIWGDFVVACYADNEVQSVKHHFPDCDVLAFIPEEELLTAESRSVLPTTMDYREAVAGSAIANVLIAAIINGDLRLAGKMMAQDHWHERYRQDLVPHLAKIREIAQQEEAYGAFLSGAGPTVLLLTPPEKTDKIYQRMQQLDHHARIDILHIDKEGTQVF